MAVEESTTNPTSSVRALARTQPTPRHTGRRNVTPPRRSGTVCDASVQTSTLYVREGDAFHEAPAGQILLQARKLIDRQFHTDCLVLGSPHLTRLFLKIHLGARDYEVFAVLFLDIRHRLIEYVELFRGTIDATAVHPREVAKEALARNAAAVILVHNHPSGDARPTQVDERMTLQLKAALDLVGVNVIDHMIVGESVVSFVELGIL